MTVRQALIALGLGVLGTALWERLLSPLLSWFPQVVLSVTAAISKRWEDGIYQDAAQPVSLEGFQVFLLVILGLALAVVVKPLDPSKPTDPSKPSRRNSMLPLILIVATFVLLVGILRDTSSSVERCFRSRLAVLSPYVTDHEAKELVASWTMMKSRADFDLITKNLGEQARKHNVLPLLKSLESPAPQARCL